MKAMAKVRNVTDRAFWFTQRMLLDHEIRFKQAPIILLGKLYFPSEIRPEVDANYDESWVVNFLADFHQLIWISYRSDFPPLGPARITTDSGWGCMVRTSQMLVANALRKMEGRLDIRDFGEGIDACYSLHRIVSHGVHVGKKVGEWYGPDSIGKAMEHLFEGGDSGYPFQFVHLATGCLPRGISIKEKPILFFISMRLGIERLNEAYYRHLLQFLRFHLTVGIVGGRPRASFYFVGFQESQLLYLDPHIVQTSSSDSATYHTNKVKAIPISQMDPCLAVGFLCKDQADIQCFYDFIAHVKCPAISIESVQSTSTPLLNYTKNDF